MRARQKVSRAGVELIKSFEGLRQTAARLPDGRWTIGYGHTFSAREGARVTQEDADALLRFDLLPIVDSLNNMILVPLNQNQFDSLVSFSFNIGIDNFGSSSVLKRINEGRMTEAALAMDAWRSAEFNGQTYVLAPLIRRRAAEKNLFLTPEDNVGNAPSLLVRPLADIEADAAATRPAELDAPDRGGVLSAYPAGQSPEFQSQAFQSQPVQPQPVAAAPEPAVIPTTFQPVAPEPTPVAVEAPAPQPVAPSPAAAPILSPYAASTYVSAPAAPAMPLSPYAGTYTPPAPPQPAVEVPVAPAPQAEAPIAAPQPAAYERQFIDLASATPAPAPVVPQTYVSAPVTLQPSDISPYPPAASPYISPYAQPAPQSFTPAPQSFAPQSFAPQAPAATEPPVVEMLPGGFAAPSQIRETPMPAPEPVAPPVAPAAFDPAFGAAVMSPEVAAALARAQDEQRLREEAERQAHQAAARAAEEARIRELQRAEAERLEQQRQEQDRIERARLDAERQERERAEAARQAQVRLEQEAAEQARVEQARLDAERLERERAEQARLETERLERERAEQVRLEAERLERERAEQARLEAERLERERAEQGRLEAERIERERQAAAAAAATVAVAAPILDSDAEKQRKAEAAAALMRLYSPYGGGPLGRPLGMGSAPVTQANLTPNPQPRSNDTATDPKPEAPQAAEPEPEAAKRPVDEFATQNVVTAAPAEDEDSDVPLFSTRIETRSDEDDDVADFRPFTPIMSANNMPAPIITALNPYASPLPKAAVRAAEETVVEVPRPQPVAEPVYAEPAHVEAVAAQPLPVEADDGLSWRERLQRPLPNGHQSTAPDFTTPERQASLLPNAAYAGEHDDGHAGEDWLHDGRIAMSHEEMEAHSVSWWRMFISTIWWILLSIVGIISLGVAAGAYYKSKDLSVVRNGLQPDLAAVSIVTAVIGFVLVSTSMWLMMRRLGGLKEQ